MKSIFKLLLLFFIVFQSQAQNHEVGIWQYRSVGESDIKKFLEQ
jgi:hypothetical protein